MERKYIKAKITTKNPTKRAKLKIFLDFVELYKLIFYKGPLRWKEIIKTTKAHQQELDRRLRSLIDKKLVLKNEEGAYYVNPEVKISKEDAIKDLFFS